MKDQTIIDDEQIYELWIEYLRRSEDYKILCEYVNKNGFLSLGATPESLKGKEFLPVTYLFFGDIYKQSFKETFSKISTWLETFSSLSSSVENYSNLIESDVEQLISNLKRTNKREPNIYELKNVIVQFIKNSSTLYLKVELSNTTMKNIKKRITEILKERKKIIKTIPSLMPNQNIRLEELERYLRIFDYRKDGLDYDKILSIEPHRKTTKNHENAEDYAKRAFKRDLQYAKKIIKNVEKGLFPGEYHSKKPLKNKFIKNLSSDK